MKLVLTVVAAAFFATTSAVSAATFQIDGLLSNYGASLVHSQYRNGDMSGYTLARFDERVRSGGTWDSDTGEIRFAGSLNDGDIRYRASGNVNTDGGGYLRFLFRVGEERIRRVFRFDGDLDMGPYNSVANRVISLWGDTGRCSRESREQCMGVDLRIAVSPSEVPLPASALLLLGGLGAFAGMRRKKS